MRRGGPLALILAGILAIAWGYWRSPTRLRDGFILRAATAPEATASSPRADSVEGALALSADEALSLRALVVADAFDSAEARLAAYEALAARDVAAEDLLYDAYDATFRTPDPEMEGALDRWARARPSSARAHVALASWHVSTGFRLRGGATFGKTPAESRQAFSEHLRAAREELETAQERDPAGIAASWFAMDVAQAIGNPPEVMTALQRALRLSPRSFFSRVRAMIALVPRWGGSYCRMRIVAAAARGPENPEFASLPGLVTWDSADTEENFKNRSGALRMLDSAIAVRPNYWLLLLRGQMWQRADSTVRALDDLRAATLLRPARVEPRYFMSEAEWDVAVTPGNVNGGRLLQSAARDMRLVMALDSTYHRAPAQMRTLDSMLIAYGIPR
jgi:hypothetical protein